MFKSVKFVVKENIFNFYRIFSIAKYEILADARDSKLGLWWTILNPLIQIATYWFVFGMGIRGGKPIGEIEFLDWMLAGMCVWFFISPCIKSGVSSIHSKSSIITKMKFPVSILPTTIVAKELFNHLMMLPVIYIIFMIRGMKPSIFNLEIIYYLFCAVALSISIALITSVLNMISRDVKKAVNASMRMLLYVTPILWTMDKLPEGIRMLMKCNPIYYIVEGYRDAFFYHNGLVNINIKETLVFWVIVLIMFIVGSNLMYKFKHKFIDMI